jgi:hypothetical protein
MLMRDTKSTIFQFQSTKNDIVKFAKLLNTLDPSTQFYGRMTPQELEDTANELSLFWHQLQRYWNEQNPSDKI